MSQSFPSVIARRNLLRTVLSWLASELVRRKSMQSKYMVFVLLILSTATIAAPTKKAAAKPSDAELIASAMKAAPASVAKGATIVAMESDGTMRTVRKGTNGFT